MPLRPDEKAAVVDDQLQAAIAMAKIPTNPSDARRALEGAGSCRPEQIHPARWPNKYGRTRGFYDIKSVCGKYGRERAAHQQAFGCVAPSRRFRAAVPRDTLLAPRPDSFTSPGLHCDRFP